MSYMRGMVNYSTESNTRSYFEPPEEPDKDINYNHKKASYRAMKIFQPIMTTRYSIPMSISAKNDSFGGAPFKDTRFSSNYF